MPEIIPADVPVNVVIAKSMQAIDGMARPLVAIFIDNNNWNDYGRNFFAKLHIRPIEGAPRNLHFRMMFAGHKKSKTVFSDMLDRFGDVFSIDDVDLPFASLLTDVDDYRKVIEVLGFEAGVSALRKMHDAAVARTEGNNQQVLELIKSEDFHFGALRSGGAYDAIRRGGRFFRRELPAEVDDAADDFAFTARLPSADNPYTLAFRFSRDGLFRDRASVLIGRNGVGKTQLLKSIVDALHSDHEEAFVRPRFRPPVRASRVLVFSSVPTDPFQHSIGAWHGIDYEYFAVNAVNEVEGDALLAALVACKKNSGRGGYGAFRNKSRMDVIQDAVEPLGLWDRLHLPLRARQNDDELPHVLEVRGQSYFHIGRHLNEENSIRLIQQIEWTRPVVVFDDKIQPRRLSSGEYAMLRFAAQASAAIEQGSLLLLDEPETHLHPNFVSDLMAILDNLLQSTKSIAIIATHSAYIVRETPRDRVNILTRDERTIRIDRPRMQTFGATIDSISQFVFGDTSIPHRYQRTLAKWADGVGRKLGIDGVIEQYGEELNPESLSFIARRLSEPVPPDPEEPQDL